MQRECHTHDVTHSCPTFKPMSSASPKILLVFTSEILPEPRTSWPSLPGSLVATPYPNGLSTGLQNNLSPKTKGPPVHLGTIVGIVLAVLLVAAIVLAGIYINGHPTSNAALFFIEVSTGFGPSSAVCLRISVSQAMGHLPLPATSLPSHLPGSCSFLRNHP